MLGFANFEAQFPKEENLLLNDTGRIPLISKLWPLVTLASCIKKQHIRRGTVLNRQNIHFTSVIHGKKAIQNEECSFIPVEIFWLLFSMFGGK